MDIFIPWFTLVPNINKAIFKMLESKLETQILSFNDISVTLSHEPPFYMSKVLIQKVYFQMQVRQPLFLVLSSAWIPACGCQNIS